MERLEKAKALDKLKEQAEKAQPPGTRFVFGEGSPEAKLMIVGEAPGRREAELKRPFVGAAGHLLDQLLADVGFDRDQVWITNVVKHRPTEQVGTRVVNRAPKASEVAADSPWLEGELEIIRPRVILCLGNLAASTLIHKDFKMNEERGKWFPGPLGSRALATFHPAYVLRQHGDDRERLLDLMRHDFEEAKQALEQPKQRRASTD